MAVSEQDYIGRGISDTTGKRHEIRHLPEAAEWEPAVYMWEEGDACVGGINGLDNLPIQQIVNRSKYLKEKLETLQQRAEEGGFGDSAGVYSVSITIPKDGWTAGETGEYAYYLDIANEAIAEDMTPLLIFSASDTKAAHECGIGDACETLSGKLRIYAMTIPESAITATLYLFGKTSGASSGTALPIASTTQAGIVKIGENIDVTEDGTISISESLSLADNDGNGLPDAIEKSMASPSEVKAALDGVFDD